MKRFLVAVAFGLMAIAAQAEASFDQIQTLIQQQNYAAAEKGLEEIIRNHPKSAKAFYAMAQAQAGLGNQDKARKALDIATGLNPTLDFAPASSVQSLRDAITPQVSKIEAIEESHTMRNVMLLLLLGVVGFAIWYARAEMKRKEAEEEAELSEKLAAQAERYAKQQEDARKAREALDAQAAKEIAEHNAKQDALKAHKNYGHERFDPANPDKLKSVAQFKQEQSAAAEKQRLFLEAQERREAQARADAAEASARMYRTSAQTVAQTAPTVVHTSSSGTDLLTGVMIGSMMNSHHHDTERTVVRETVREVPAPSRDSSWDDTPSTPSRSSSWDDSSSSSSSSSSSWSSSSSSDSSSSWDSGSSSSSDSSSSWD